MEWYYENKRRSIGIRLIINDTYIEAPFHDENWQLVRVKSNKKHFCGLMNGMVILILM